MNLNLVTGLLLAVALPVVADSTAPMVSAERAEAARIAMIERVASAVVCIFDEDERGGGSGVIIDPNGYGLTNYHVVAGMLESRKGLGGLNDGELYPLKVLGIDPGGDVAMFKLTGKDTFSFAKLGDSDTVRVGDTAIAMGNPFVLSEDYTPTVTMGIVSGVNRYQYGAGAGNTLLYSDCIQVDASINPGNSGGPLFNLAGEVIGINGRISVSMRGRVNVGMGYAITANQIKPFIPGLRAGLLVEHGTLEAVVRDHHDGSAIFMELREDGPAWSIGIRPGDVLLRFDGRDIRSANEFASILGTLPANWPVDVTVRKPDGTEHTGITRTAAIRVPVSESFEPDPALNDDAVLRVLDRFRESITPDEVDWSKPMAYEWNESIAMYGVQYDDAPSCAVADSGEGPIVYDALAEENSRLLVLDESIASDLDASWAWLSASADMEMALRAMFAVQRLLLPATDSSRLSGLKHRGADRDVHGGEERSIPSAPYECIGRPSGPDLDTRYCFDPQTGQLRMIVATNHITRDSVKMSLHGATPFSSLIDAEGRWNWLINRENPQAPFRLRSEVGESDTASDRDASMPINEESRMQRILERTVKLYGAKVGRTAGYGSGIIVSSNGLLLTVDSALLDGRNVRAVLHDGTVCGVESVYTDRDLQLALLRLAPRDATGAPTRYPYFAIDAAAQPTIGQWVLAAGNPFKVASGAEPVSLARGQYCGRTRLDATRGTQDFPYHGDVLVIDAITSTPGFPGGALIGLDGKLLGLVGRVVEARTTHTMLNYAMPADLLADFVKRAFDPATRRTAPATACKPVYHGIKFFELGYRSNPVYVERVRRGSPAARAGLRTDDLIIGANGTPIPKLETLQRVIDACQPGDTLELSIMRNDAVKRISIVLEEDESGD